MELPLEAQTLKEPISSLDFFKGEPAPYSISIQDKYSKYKEKIGEAKDIQRWMPDQKGIYRVFRMGTIFWHPEAGAKVISKVFIDKWLFLRENKSFDLGYPLTDVETINKNWHVVHFQNGSLFYNSSNQKVSEIHGRIRLEWAKFNSKENCLGLPISDQVNNALKESSQFQSGTILINKNNVVQIFCKDKNGKLISHKNSKTRFGLGIIPINHKVNHPLYFVTHKSNKDKYLLFNKPIFNLKGFPNKGEKYYLINLMDEINFPTTLNLSQDNLKKGEGSPSITYVVALADKISFNQGNIRIFGENESVKHLTLIADTVNISGKTKLTLNGSKRGENLIHGGTFTLIARKLICESGGTLNVQAKGLGAPGLRLNEKTIVGDGGNLYLYLEKRIISDPTMVCIKTDLSGGDIVNNKVRSDYLGCYKDKGKQDSKLGKRDLNGYHFFSKNLEIDACKRACNEKGFKYSGLQYSGNCFCGNRYGKYGRLSDNSCQSLCNGNKNEFCGGAWANSIYQSEKIKNGIDGIIKEKFEIIDDHRFRFIFGNWLNAFIKHQKINIDRELISEDYLQATKHFLKIQEVMKNVAKPKKISIDGEILRNLLNDYKNKILPILNTFIEIRETETALPRKLEYFVDTKNNDVYLPPSSLLIETHKTLNQNWILGFVNYNPNKPSLIELSFDAKLKVDPTVEFLLKPKFKDLGLNYRGLFSGWNLKPHPIKWTGLRDGSVLINGTNLHVKLLIERDRSMLVFHRLSSAGLPWKMDWISKLDPRIKGTIFAPPISFQKRAEHKLLLENDKIFNNGSQAVEVEFLADKENNLLMFNPPIILKPKVEVSLAKIIPKSRTDEWYLKPEAILYIEEVDPAENFKVLKPGLIENIKIINHIGNDLERGLLHSVEFYIEVKNESSPQKRSLKKGPYNLAPKGTEGSEMNFHFIKSNKTNKVIISQGKLIYEEGDCVSIKDSIFHEDEFRVIHLTKDMIDKKAKHCKA